MPRFESIVGYFSVGRSSNQVLRWDPEYGGERFGKIASTCSHSRLGNKDYN